MTTPAPVAAAPTAPAAAIPPPITPGIARQLHITIALLTVGLLAFDIATSAPLLRVLAHLAYALLPVVWLCGNWITLDRQEADEMSPEMRRQLQARKRRWHSTYATAAAAWIVLVLGQDALGLRPLPSDALLAIPLQVIILLAVLASVGVVTCFYFNEVVARCPNPHLALANRILRILVGALILATLSAIALHLAIPHAGRIGLILLTSLNLVLVVELLLRAGAHFFRPRRPGHYQRERLDFFVLEMLAHPSNATRVFRDLLHRQLGFEASQSQFFKTFARGLVPALLASVLLLWSLSSAVLLTPGERALVLRFGRPTGILLDAGLHWKAPWPIDRIRTVDVGQVRQTRVGSHRQTDTSGAIYREGEPILWSNAHGVEHDELLILAPPADMLADSLPGEAPPPGRTAKTPSISLAGVDVTVDYRVRDPQRYLLSATDPDACFTAIAMATASRTLLRHDIDTLFCQGRIDLPDILRSEIQSASDAFGLGLAVLHVGIGGVHPPQVVATDFEAFVSAQQGRETAIETAQQFAIRDLVGVSGSMEQSADLLAAMTASADTAQLTAHLDPCEGTVAQILSAAQAYRWQRPSTERGQAGRFIAERLLYRAAPRAYLNHRVMTTIESALADARKYMLVGNRDQLIIRLTTNPTDP